MATTRLTLKFLLLSLVLSLASSEIHRAKSHGAKYQQQTSAPSKATDESDEQAAAALDECAELSRSSVWCFSVAGAALVGACGIIPLYVIPLEAGPRIRGDGADASRMKLFLSFAVGGLLGDVFLHLLPETWNKVTAEDSFHSHHTGIGLWVLAGICIFLILEKTFPNQEEKIEHKEYQLEYDNSKMKVNCNRNYQLTQKISDSTEEIRPRYNTRLQSKKSEQNSIFQNRANTFKRETNRSEISNKRKPVEKNYIKTSGYLNLFANFIDNFTHGLAVAASFLISYKVGVLTTCAIILHEIPHEVGDFAILLRSGFTRWDAAKAQVITSIGGILGAVVTLGADSAENTGNRTAWVLPFTSGGFIYIALVTVIPDLLNEQHLWESIKQVFFLCLGIGLMGVVALAC